MIPSVALCLASSGCTNGERSPSSSDCQAQVRAAGIVCTSYGSTRRSATKLSSAEVADCDDVGADPAGSIFPESPRTVATWRFADYSPSRVLGVRSGSADSLPSMSLTQSRRRNADRSTRASPSKRPRSCRRRKSPECGEGTTSSDRTSVPSSPCLRSAPFPVRDPVPGTASNGQGLSTDGDCRRTGWVETVAVRAVPRAASATGAVGIVGPDRVGAGRMGRMAGGLGGPGPARAPPRFNPKRSGSRPAVALVGRQWRPNGRSPALSGVIP